jgi:hypothetical protein
MGKGPLLSWKALQQDLGLGEIEAAREGGTNIVSFLKQGGADANCHSLSGEASKLVVDNYLRSLAHGNKYVFQSLPKVLTLWLEHASAVEQPFDPKRGDNAWVFIQSCLPP